MRAQVGSIDYKKLKKQGWSEELDERNYRKEYDNYQGRPEQIARRSSRNKARRVMGDKTKINMDVGHKDNDPMNNDPSNLRNEVPSDNRREPRLREQEKKKQMDADGYLKPNFVKLSKKEKEKKEPEAGPDQYEEVDLDEGYLELTFKDKQTAERAYNYINNEIWAGGNPPYDDIAQEGNEIQIDTDGNLNRRNQMLKDLKALPRNMKFKVTANEEVNEMTSSLPWLNKAVAKIHQMTHPKGYENLVKKYMDGMKDKDNREHPSKWAAELARQYKGVEGRDFIRYINKLVNKGKLPQELKAEYTPEQMSFKQFVEVLNKNADQGDYIDDFVKSDAPQFKGKSKEKRIAMAVAAYKDKNEDKKLPPHLAKFFDKKGNLKFDAAKRLQKGRSKKNWKDVTPKGFGPNEDMDAQPQDSSIENRPGTQPKKYYKGLDKDTKKKRDAHFKKKKEGPAPGDADAETKPSVHTKQFKKMYGESEMKTFKEVYLNENEGLKNKSKKSGISVGILKKVYDRGLAAYKTGHRPGTTAPQWAMARVNSFITKGSGTWGGADKDLAKQAKGKSEEIEEDFFDPITEACWAGYKQVGMKDKNGKQVPNCVPEEKVVKQGK